MKIDLAITNDNQESEICRFISAINKFNIFFKRIENIDNETNELTIIIANKKDDERQIKRWLQFAGPKGRFRRALMNKISKHGKEFNDYSVSPVIRQDLLHWGYELTKKDYESYKKNH